MGWKTSCSKLFKRNKCSTSNNHNQLTLTEFQNNTVCPVGDNLHKDGVEVIVEHTCSADSVLAARRLCNTAPKGAIGETCSGPVSKK